MGKRIGDIGEVAVTEIILIAGFGAIAYFAVVKPLMENFLGTKDDDDKVDAQEQLSPDDNPFSPQYAPFANTAESTATAMNFKSLCDYWHNLKRLYDDADTHYYQGGGHDMDIAIAGETINNSFGFWHNVRIDDLNNVFENIQSKQGVAAVASYLNCVYNKDLWTLLKNGYTFLPSLRNGLNNGVLASILKRVDTLPDDLSK